MTLRNTLISAGELHAAMGSETLRILDARFSLADRKWGLDQYSAGHIPGAQYADLDNDLAGPVTSATGRHPLPDADVFASRLRDWGVSNDSQVVVYDDAGGGIAARLWWMLRWLGHESVALLDGGFAAWVAADLPTSSASETPLPGNFAGSPDPDRVVTTAELVADLADGSVLLLDARDPARYAGRSEPIDRVAGHVPGAVNAPFAESLTDTGHWKREDDLRDLWATHLERGDGRPPVAMCGSGVTACHLILSAVQAGVPEPRLYAGSWSEWIQDPDRPVAVD